MSYEDYLKRAKDENIKNKPEANSSSGSYNYNANRQSNVTNNPNTSGNQKFS